MSQTAVQTRNTPSQTASEEYVLVSAEGAEMARTAADALFGTWLEWTILHVAVCVGDCLKDLPMCKPCQVTAEVHDEQGNVLLVLLEADRVTLCPGDSFRLKWDVRP